MFIFYKFQCCFICYPIFLIIKMFAMDDVVICGMKNETFEVYNRKNIFSHEKIHIIPKHYVLHHLQCVIANTLQCWLPYTWHTIVVQSVKCLPWSTFIHVFSMFLSTCIRSTNTTTFLRRSTEKTKPFSFDCLGNLPPWTTFNAKWFFGAWIPSIIHIPLRNIHFHPNTNW